MKKYTNSEDFKVARKEELEDYDLKREQLDALRKAASEVSRDVDNTLDSDTE